MNNNSNLLKEAIADAKAVRATALANAQAALQEAFQSRFESVFADKLREESAEEESLPVGQPEETTMDETVEPKDATPSKNDGTKGWSAKNTDSAGKPTTKNITPNSIPAAKDGGDGTKGWSKKNKGNDMDGTPAGVKENTEECAEQEEESVEETVTNEDLDEIIRELEMEANEDPAAAGGAPEAPVPAPESPVPTGGGENPEEHEQEIKSGDTVTITKAAPTTPEVPEAPAPEAPAPTAGGEAPPMEEEDINLDELLKDLNEEAKEEEKDEEEEEEEKEVDESIKNQLNEAISQRDEAYKTVEYLKNQINEINLLNAKLLYTNKLFKEFGMNRDQKVKVVEAFDLTKNVREVKLTYANWCESLNFGGKAQRKAMPSSEVTVVTEGRASKPVASTKPAEIITENYSDQARRFQKLAGIPVNK